MQVEFADRTCKNSRMELPDALKHLYRHWPLHTATKPRDMPGVPKPIATFVAERIRIWEQRASDNQPPYTQDPVLAHYRFCNIFRELDRQTIEIHELLNPLRDDFPLWLLNVFYARMVARPQTLRAVGLLSFDHQENERLHMRLNSLPRPRYGTPYVFPISAIQNSPTPTRELFITRHLPAIMPGVAREIATWHKLSAYEGVRRVLPLFGYSLAFHWTEALIDVAYQYPDRIDLFKRFPIGPGAVPTFAALCTDDPSLFVERLAAEGATTDIAFGGKPLRLSAENWEGIGCEYRKYVNLSHGRGRRRIYEARPGLFT